MLTRKQYGFSFFSRSLAGLLWAGFFWAGLCPAWAETPCLSLEQTCQRIAGKLASVQVRDCFDGGLMLSGACSNKGTPILVKEYGPLKNRQPRARILLVGGIHGDEYSSISIVFKWMQILDVHHSGLFHWIFVPLLNPDGLLQPHSTRTNASGIDLNRNFPGPLWQEVSYSHWEGVAGKNPRYYPGTIAASEPETRFLAKLIQDFRPQAIVSVHSPLNLVDYDGPGTPPSSLGGLPLRRLGNFSGTLGNYGGVQNRIPVITIELPSSARLPSSESISYLWRELVAWLIRNVPVESEVEQIQAVEKDVLLGKGFLGK